MTKEQKFLLLIVLIVAGASVTYYVNNKKAVQVDTTSVTQEVKVETNTTTQTGSNTQASISNKYTSHVNYNVPEEKVETIHVGITLKGGVIEDISFSYDKPKEDGSAYNLGNFEKALATANLIGKKLDEVSLSRLGGASLTTNAFMKAVTEIKGKVNG